MVSPPDVSEESECRPGALLASDGAVGRRTWEDFLAEQLA
jgi:hypothetical protein